MKEVDSGAQVEMINISISSRDAFFIIFIFK